MALQPFSSLSQELTTSSSSEAQQLALLQQCLNLQALSAESLQEEANKASAVYRHMEAQLRSALHALEEENRALHARVIQAEARTREVQEAREVETLASARLVQTLQTEVSTQAARIGELEGSFKVIDEACRTVPPDSAYPYLPGPAWFKASWKLQVQTPPCEAVVHVCRAQLAALYK